MQKLFKDNAEEKQLFIANNHFFNQIALICSWLVIILSFIALFGWFFDILVIAQFSKSYIPMAPLTAIIFILISAAIIIYVSHLPGRAKKILFNSFLAMFWILLFTKIIEFFFSIRFGIEYILVQNPEKFKAVLTGRISPITAAIFIASGISMLFLLFTDKKENKAKEVAGFFALLAFSASFVLILGYLYGAPFLYGGNIIPVALTTSLAFLLISTGLIASAGPMHFPLSLFIGPSAKSLLLRSFFPLILFVIFIHEILFRVFKQFLGINLVLETALEAIAISFLTGIVILRISKVIGGNIDTANHERKKAMKKVKDEYTFRKAIEDSILSGIAAISLEGDLIYANPSFSKMLGWSKKELEKMKPPFPFWPPEEIENINNAFASTIKGKVPSGGVELIFMRKNGERFNVLLLASPLQDVDGKIKGWISSITDISEHRKAEDKIKHLAFYDTLTDIPNRTYFDSLLAKILSEAKRTNNKIAVFFLDLDNFKKVKNTLGYDFSDKLLIKITNKLKEVIPDNDIVGKVGEDEFLLFSSIESRQEAAKYAQYILEHFKDPWLVDGQQIRIIANVGIALFPEDGEDVDTLEKNADTAMSNSKNEGSYTYQYFEKSMATSREKAYERLVIAGDLSNAIKNHELIVHYQPIVNIKIDEIIGVEALVRWQKPDGTLIMPGNFIPLAEDTGQIVLIGNYVLETAYKQSEKWQQAGFPYLKTSINLSTKQFMYKNLVDEIKKLHRSSGKNIVLEITESVIMHNPELAIKTMNQLKELGYSISIDDFGTGYASLSYLKKFPVDYLKIDKSFIDNIATSPKDQAIVASIIEMAHGLGIMVVAEGVETEQQLAFLHNLGCDNAQGFLFSKPKSPKEIEKLLARYSHGHRLIS